MRQIVTIISLFVFSIMSIYGKSKTNIEGVAINVAVLLVEETDLDKMIDICKYYHLTQVMKEDDYTVFAHSDGSKIRFRLDESTEYATPIVELTTSDKLKNIEKILYDLKFRKTSEGFERINKYNHQIILGKIVQSKPIILTLTKIKNN